jgi:hypothetical protein
MELLIALSLLAVGVMLERKPFVAEPIRARIDRRR